MPYVLSDRLRQTVLVRAPGLTSDMFNLSLFNVVDEFLRKTNAWVYWDTIELEIGQDTYNIAVPEGSSLVRFLSFTHNGIPLTASPGATGASTSGGTGMFTPELVMGDGDALFDPSYIQPSGGAFSFAVFTPTYVTIEPEIDDETVKFPLRGAYALSISKESLSIDSGDWTLPDWMWDMFFDAWLNGVLADLYSMPAKPWTSEKNTILHGRRFRNKIAFHKQEARRGYSYNTPAWRFPRFG